MLARTLTARLSQLRLSNRINLDIHSAAPFSSRTFITILNEDLLLRQLRRVESLHGRGGKARKRSNPSRARGNYSWAQRAGHRSYHGASVSRRIRAETTSSRRTAFRDSPSWPLLPASTGPPQMPRRQPSSPYNYVANLPQTTDSDQQTYRIDHTFGPSDSMFVRATKFDLTNTAPTNLTPIGDQILLETVRFYQVTETPPAFTPNVLNQARIAFIESQGNRSPFLIPPTAVSALGFTRNFQHKGSRVIRK